MEKRAKYSFPLYKWNNFVSGPWDAHYCLSGYAETLPDQ